MQLPPELAWQGLFDGTGQHLGGVYDPVMVEGQLTGTHAVMCSGRPASRLLFHNVLCADPHSQIALVWFLPMDANPLAGANDMLGYLVQVLDAGHSVMLHAVAEDDINAVFAAVSPMLGGGRA